MDHQVTGSVAVAIYILIETARSNWFVHHGCQWLEAFYWGRRLRLETHRSGVLVGVFLTLRIVLVLLSSLRHTPTLASLRIKLRLSLSHTLARLVLALISAAHHESQFIL